MLLGDSDETTLEAAQIFSAVLSMRGKNESSRKLLLSSAETARQVLGAEHRVTLRLETNLAVIDHNQNRLKQARTNLQEIANTYTRVYGDEDPETLIAQAKFAGTLASLGENEDAEKILLATLEPAIKILGPNHPETLRIGRYLANVRSNLQNYEAANEGIDAIHKAQRHLVPANNIELFETEKNRADILLQQSKLDEGERILHDLIPQMRANLAPDDSMLGSALALWARALSALNDPLKAEQINAEAIVILRKTPDHRDLIDTEGTQAVLLLRNGKPKEAEPFGAGSLSTDRDQSGAARPHGWAT